jgi:KipI family sensor histidine kinase inhibitor
VSAARPIVTAYGEEAALVDLGVEDAPDRAARTHAAAEALREALPGADVVVGAGTVAVVGADRAEVEAALAGKLAGIAPAVGREHVIAAAYDGPDLEAVAAALGIPAEEVIARHAGSGYVAELLGFLPGFAYLSAGDAWRLAVPRRPSPRPQVPAGSIAIAAAFTGIYPFASPGGWNLIARAIDAVPFDPGRDPPLLFQPGDRVRFAPVAPGDVPPRAAVAASAAVDPAGRRGLVVIAAPACATVQDHGRTGQLGRGIPPSGPLDPEAFEAANVQIGNPPGTAAIEVPLGAIEVEARGRVTISVDGMIVRTLEDGERYRVAEGERAVRYLAVAGGVEVPMVLGARATLLAAKIGGYLGRPLRRRDFLPVGEARTTSGERPPHRGTGDEVIAIDPGPHVARFPAGALEALLGTEWRVSRLGDRVGVRLEGGRVPRDAPDLALPVPMIRGAIEITTDGTPIVLGPDHPTTGGYPVLAVVRRAGQGKLAQRRPGEGVRFVLGG